MQQNQAEIKASIREFILREFLPGEDPAALEDTTSLISTGILDSIATVKLISYLEEQFGVEFEAHEMTAEFLDSVADITRTVEDKQVGE
jgi:acyl carrier protein